MKVQPAQAGAGFVHLRIAHRHSCAAKHAVQTEPLKDFERRRRDADGHRTVERRGALVEHDSADPFRTEQVGQNQPDGARPDDDHVGGRVRHGAASPSRSIFGGLHGPGRMASGCDHPGLLFRNDNVLGYARWNELHHSPLDGQPRAESHSSHGGWLLRGSEHAFEDE